MAVLIDDNQLSYNNQLKKYHINITLSSHTNPMKTKPDLGFWKLWNLSFGFFGVQIAYALQSANVSRIFATLGADPHDLSYFWILPL